MSNDSIKFFRDIISKLDDEIDLDFEEVNRPEEAQFTFSRVSVPGSAAGMAYSKAGSVEGSYNWNTRDWKYYYINDITWEKSKQNTVVGSFNYLEKYPEINGADATTILHELGHALGLDHPGNDPWGKWHTTYDSVMSYNAEDFGDLTPYYTKTDLDSLKYIWGKESGKNGHEPFSQGNTPTAINLSTLTIKDETPGGATVAILSTDDKDSSDSHKYYLQKEDWGDNSAFTISGNELKIKNEVNRNKKFYYNVWIKTVDNNGRSFKDTYQFIVSREKIIDFQKTYSISTSASSIKEGDTVKTTINTTGLEYYDIIYWSISGKGIDSNDFIQGDLQGYSYVKDGSFSFSHSLSEDKITEGDEIFDIKLFSDYRRTEQLGDGASIKIEDTSKKKEKTYSITLNSSSVKEGGLFTINIETTGLSYVDILYWSLSGKNITPDDLNTGILKSQIYPATGSFTLSNRIRDDKVSEGNEKLDFKLFSDSKRTNQVGKTVTIDIIDSLLSDLSTLLPSYKINNENILEKITNTVTADLISYKKNSSNFKFYNLGKNRYAIKTDSGFDEISEVSTLDFPDKDLDLVSDIKGTFDQITGLNTDSGEMFRLYNAAFARFPDSGGLKYWIDKYSSGENDSRAVAQSFLASNEFADRYGQNVTDEKYVTTLYQNVLGRAPDTSGLNYWLGQLSSGAETRYEALLGFAESAENKTLFTEMTGFG
tara:strand:- start:400 stop:2529 length:2130 start_codon:yes stop_codon:yes gene_type:complete